MQSLDTITFTGQQIVMGKFRCPVDDPRFCDSGPIQGFLLVFPRTSVTITHAGGDPIVADPNVVMFYNKSQEYRRGRISPAGDRCNWFAFNPVTVQEVVARFDPTVNERPDRPFSWTHGLADTDVYLFQHAMVRLVEQTSCDDGWLIEENALTLLDRVVTDAFRSRGQRPCRLRSSTRQAHMQTVADAQALLARNFSAKLQLDPIARRLHVSSYHLCRVFRQETGRSMHDYLTQLRLRAALDALSQGATDLTLLALEVGFSSHSHFSHVFRQSLGMTPSAVRGHLTHKRWRQMSKNLIASRHRSA